MNRGLWRQFGWAADAALLLGLAMLLRGATIGVAEIDWDESAFVLVAREILHGHWPYTAVFEHKPIGLYLHVAAALAIVGDSPAAVRLLGIVTAAGAAFVVRTIARHRFGLSRAWALFLGACYVVAMLGFGGEAVYSEHLVNLYALLCALLISGPGAASVLLAGLAAGVAIEVNYLALTVVAGLVVGRLLGEPAASRWPSAQLARFALPFAGGVLLATLLCLLPILLFSDLADYFGLQLRFLAGYPATGSAAPGFADLAAKAAVFLPLAASVVALIYLRPREGSQASREVRLMAGFGVGATIAAVSTGYAFDHYFLLVIPPALLLPASLAALVGDRDLRAMTAAVIGGSALMIGMPGLIVAAVAGRNLVASAQSGESRDLSHRLAAIGRQRVEPGSPMFVLCGPLALYQLLHARPATRYPFTMHNLNPQYAAALGIDMDAEVAGIFARRPSLVVLGDFANCWGIPRSSWDKVRTGLQGNGYRPFARVEGYSFYEPTAPPRTAVTR